MSVLCCALWYQKHAWPAHKQSSTSAGVLSGAVSMVGLVNGIGSGTVPLLPAHKQSSTSAGVLSGATKLSERKGG